MFRMEKMTDERLELSYLQQRKKEFALLKRMEDYALENPDKLHIYFPYIFERDNLPRWLTQGDLSKYRGYPKSRVQKLFPKPSKKRVRGQRCIGHFYPLDYVLEREMKIPDYERKNDIVSVPEDIWYKNSSMHWDTPNPNCRAIYWMVLDGYLINKSEADELWLEILKHEDYPITFIINMAKEFCEGVEDMIEANNKRR